MPEHLELPVRYCSMHAAEEGRFRHGEKLLRRRTDRTAFVLVDVWEVRTPGETSYAGLGSFFRRARKITEERIKPALQAAREAGLLVVHAPTDYVAVKYPQHRRLEQELGISPREPEERDWPPPDFVRERWREFDEDRYFVGFYEVDRRRRELTYIPDVVEPSEDEYVVSSGRQMNEVLKRHGILNLIYVGFATNMCLIDKPGALREMGHRRGYRTVLLRDCTTAIENQNTVGELLMTKIWTEWVEMVAMAYTATSEDFIRACKGNSP